MIKQQIKALFWFIVQLLYLSDQTKDYYTVGRNLQKKTKSKGQNQENMAIAQPKSCILVIHLPVVSGRKGYLYKKKKLKIWHIQGKTSKSKKAAKTQPNMFFSDDPLICLLRPMRATVEKT